LIPSNRWVEDIVWVALRVVNLDRLEEMMKKDKVRLPVAANEFFLNPEAAPEVRQGFRRYLERKVTIRMYWFSPEYSYSGNILQRSMIPAG